MNQGIVLPIVTAIVFLFTGFKMALLAFSITISSSSPQTPIVSQSNSRYPDSFIQVGGELYRCWGSGARVGEVVAYDPGFPNRCRRMSDIGQLTSGEQLIFGLFVLAGLALLYFAYEFWGELNRDRQRNRDYERSVYGRD